MLRNRLITAAVLVPLAIASILALPELWFARYVWGVAILVACWEWTALSGITTPMGRGVFVAAMLAAQLTAQHWAPFAWALEALAWPIVPSAAVLWWLLVGMAMRSAPTRMLGLRLPTWAMLALGFFVLLAGWIIMVWLQMHFGAKQVLFFFVLVCLADAAAYFVGRRYGRTKLLPEISPGKTVEGAYGAVFMGGLVALCVGLYYHYGLESSNNSYFDLIKVSDFVLLCVVTVIVSISGDLFESLVKRWRGVKDSGALLPGHGGVLDRIDSLLAGVSVFYLGSFLRDIFL